ncbi:MAG TPA: nucleotidyl transferase AbiEii/AbiGii toxin family protein [Polyangium sp.]|jgi:predicted nucleotidyltransferase|nr:nucleotidyl transferase AbiEii/AbiGii toxin family protein [Polyangium sp.]
MNPVISTLLQASKDLEAMGRRWALIGGLAVSARAEPRTTRDVDLVVVVNDDVDAEALIFALQSLGYRVLAIVEQTATKRLSTVRLERSSIAVRGVVLDLLFASSGIEQEIIDDAEMLEIVPGVEVPVARTAHLLALKVLARDDRARPQDWDDIRALLVEASPDDIVDVHHALDLIEQRGFHREKRLHEIFEQMRNELSH